MYGFLLLFITFLIYSIIGWIVEIIGVYLESKTIVNRGFLIGPYCPIYGVSCILMLMFLKKYVDDPLILFIVAIFICTMTEYMTSFIMEKVFKTRWWDYSHMPFNVNGRICLVNSVLFGIGGIVLLYVLNPIFNNLLLSIPIFIFYIISILLLVIFITDLLISFNIIFKLEKNINNTSTRKDSTEEIREKVKDIINNSSKLAKRVVKAYPDFKITKKKN